MRRSLLAFMSLVDPSSRRLAVQLGGVIGVVALSAALGCENGGDGGQGSASGTETATDTAGDGDGDGDGDGGIEPEVAWPNLPCDPIVPEYCAYPFPNNVFTVDAPSRATGRQLALSNETMPRHTGGGQPLPAPFNERDGFQVRPTILTHLPGATIDGLADPNHYADTLEPTSKTIILDAESGELVAHFAELDVNAESDADRSLMLQPAASLEKGRRYIVAIRDVVDAQGVAIPPSPAFETLRDLSDPTDPRAPLYADILARLEQAGVPTDDLQQAWDFTTASVDDVNGRLLTMRDEAFDALGSGGPGYRIESVEDEFSADIQKKISGVLEVPLYLDKPGPGGIMQTDDQGKPVQNGMAEYPFTIMIPRSAYAAPAPSVILGHGLFGSRAEVEAGPFQAFANQSNFVMMSMDFIGMSAADPALLGLLIQNGTLEQFAMVPDRLQQGILNFLLLSRLAVTDLANDPEFDDGNGGSVLDPSSTFYYGGSQGGIMGAVYMALALDAERGALAVPGEPYQLLLERSVNYDSFADIIDPSYENAFDKQMVLTVAQLLWDRAEPVGWSPHVRRDPLPGTEAHEVLMLTSIGDHQVSTLAAHCMARSIGVVNIAPVNRSVWGLEEVQAPYTGSALVEHDFGLPPEPLVNQPMREGEDPHGKLAGVPEAFTEVEQFLLTGTVPSVCDGPCDPS